MDPRHIVTDTAFRVDPTLLGVDLASPQRRCAALLVDLLLAAIVSGLGGAGVIAALAGIVSYKLLTKAKQRRFRWLRSMGAGLAGIIMFSVTLGIMSDETEEAAQTAQDGEVATATSAVAFGSAVGDIVTALHDSDGTTESQMAVAQKAEVFARSLKALQGPERLKAQIKALKKENERLRESIDAPSVLRPVQAMAADFGLTLGWVGLYFTLLTAWWNGQTPGKRLFRIRVYRLDGIDLTLWTAFERFSGYAAGLATGLLGFVQVYWDPNRQCIQDRICCTVVVRLTEDGRPRRDWAKKQALESFSDRSAEFDRRATADR